jgi:hypothetical protein
MQLLSAISVQEKGEKPDRKPNSLPYGLRNPHGKYTSAVHSPTRPRVFFAKGIN